MFNFQIPWSRDKKRQIVYIQKIESIEKNYNLIHKAC